MQNLKRPTNARHLSAERARFQRVLNAIQVLCASLSKSHASSLVPTTMCVKYDSDKLELGGIGRRQFVERHSSVPLFINFSRGVRPGVRWVN